MQMNETRHFAVSWAPFLCRAGGSRYHRVSLLFAQHDTSLRSQGIKVTVQENSQGTVLDKNLDVEVSADDGAGRWRASARSSQEGSSVLPCARLASIVCAPPRFLSTRRGNSPS